VFARDMFPRPARRPVLLGHLTYTASRTATGQDGEQDRTWAGLVGQQAGHDGVQDRTACRTRHQAEQDGGEMRKIARSSRRNTRIALRRTS